MTRLPHKQETVGSIPAGATTCTLPTCEYVVEHGLLMKPRSEHKREVILRRFMLEPALADQIIDLCNKVAADDPMQTYDPVQNRSFARFILKELTK